MNKHGNLFKMMGRDIRRNFLQYLSMIIITMLSVILFCGFISNTLTLDKKVKSYFKKSNLTDLTAQFSKIDSSVLSYFSELEKGGKIDAHEYRFYAEGSVRGKNGKIYAGQNSISKPIIVEGASGVLLDIGMKKSDELNIGDNIEVTVAGYPAMQFKITGFMYFAEVSTFTYRPIYIDEKFFCTALFEKTSIPLTPGMLYNQVIIKTTETAKTLAEINAHYAAEANSGLIFAYDSGIIESVASLRAEVKTSLKMIYIFPVIFLLVSVLVIMTTVSALILRDRTNIGTLKGLGISNKKIMLYYACFGAALCLVGGVSGAAISPFIVPNVMLVKYGLIYSMPASGGVVFSLLWSAIAVLFVCAVALIIGIAVCRSVMSEKPAQCMRAAPPKDNFLLKTVTVKASDESIKSDISKEKMKNGNRTLRMAVRNIIIKPTRALMTIVGVMGCVALLVCSFGIGDTVNNSVALELGGQFNYGISTIYTDAASTGFLRLMDNLKEDGQIRGYETYKTFYITARSDYAVKSLKVMSIEEDSYFTTLRPKDGALISKAIADEMKINKGDTIDITAGANAYKLKITGIVKTAVTKGIFVCSDMFNENYHSLGMWIDADETAGLMDLIKTNNGNQDAVSMRERRETVERAVSSINTIKLTMMIFSIALSIVVLYNLSLLNVKERNRSIATLKVLGFSNFEVSLSLLYEIMILVLAGTVFGLFLGYPILYLVLSINKIEIVAFIYHIKPVSYVIAALLSLLSAATINIVFGMAIRKIRMIDSLKSVE